MIAFTRVIEVKSAPVSSQNPILFVHGWTGNAYAWFTMQDRFFNDGWPSEILKAYSFSASDDYSSSANILNAEYIKLWVDDILNKTGAEIRLQRIVGTFFYFHRVYGKNYCL